MATLRDASLAKNRAFEALEKADLAIAKRRRRGPVPETWLARREELPAEYERARAAVGSCSNGEKTAPGFS